MYMLEQYKIQTNSIKLRHKIQNWVSYSFIDKDAKQQKRKRSVWKSTWNCGKAIKVSFQ